MKPNFYVITTTYKRPEAVLRAVNSVKDQSYQVWKHIIVVDDTTSDYSNLEKIAEQTPSLHLIKNNHNQGKNASVNHALNYLRTENFDGYIVFLDDDDWLNPNCLNDFAEAIHTTNQSWLVSQRVNVETGLSYTTNHTGRDIISYRYHCLLTKKFFGDATHCLHFPSIQSINFPLTIKNAEEWLYFAHISTINPTFLYLPKAGTMSLGYAPAGLTDTYHLNQEQKQNAHSLPREIWQRRIFSPIVLAYTLLRFVRSLI